MDDLAFGIRHLSLDIPGASSNSNKIACTMDTIMTALNTGTYRYSSTGIAGQKEGRNENESLKFSLFPLEGPVDGHFLNTVPYTLSSLVLFTTKATGLSSNSAVVLLLAVRSLKGSKSGPILTVYSLDLGTIVFPSSSLKATTVLPRP